MSIVDIRLYPYQIPFVRSFSTAHGTQTAREGAIVEVITEEGISGIGEVAPLPGFSGGSLASALDQMPEVAAVFKHITIQDALDLLNVEIERGAWDSALCCGLEMALLDALSKAQGRSVGVLLARPGIMPRRGVQVNAVVGVRETGVAIAAAREAVRAGFGCVKLKVGIDAGIQQEVERIGAVRDAIGSNVHLRLDANEAWGFEEAVAICSACAQYDIQYVEQPLKARDLAGMQELRKAVSMLIAADEAVGNLESARRVLDGEAADILIIKPQLAGGLRAGQQIIREAAGRGVDCVVTSVLEAGIGVTAALHLAAAMPGVTLECGLATLPLLADDLLVDGLTLQNGFLAVPPSPGLGVELDREALARYSM